jgi:hypothetical protein
VEASAVTVNGTEGRRIAGEREVEELCHSLRALPSFLLQASRYDGVELDLAADANGATVFYLDMKRGVKMASAAPSASGGDIVRMRIDALPEMELEIERRHLVPLEEALAILRQFLSQRELNGMLPWPVD